MRDLDAHRIFEQRGHREPVRQRAHHAAFCRRAHILQPRVFPLQGEREDKDHSHGKQQAECQHLHFPQRCRLFGVARTELMADDGVTCLRA